jgi:MarR family transcriptional regulator for hemolysin
MTQTELAFELELEQATLVRLLDRMEQNGLIERRPDPGDRRAKLISLTSHGKEQADFVRSLADQIRKQIFAGLDHDDIRRANDLLDAIGTNLADLESFNVIT